VILTLLASELAIFRFVPSVKATQHNFGYETQGGSVDSVENIIRGSVFTITEAGTADSITFYGSNSNGKKIKCAIYKHSDLSLVKATNERTDIPITYAWYTFTFSEPKPSLTANTEYILVVWSNSAFGAIAYSAGDADQGHYQSLTYDSFPNPLVPTHNNNKYSIYCTYTAGATLKEVADSLSLSDSVLRDKMLAVSDSVGIADAPLKHWSPQISDSIALSDSILRNKAFQILDSLGLSDTILRGEQFSVSDSISLSELVTVITEIIKQVTDSLSLSDIVSLNKAWVLADQIQLTDNVYVNKILIISD